MTSLLKKNNKTAPIMEENEEAQSPDSEQHLSVTHNSWVTSGESTESVKMTNSALFSTKSPIDLWTMPVNGKE